MTLLDNKNMKKIIPWEPVGQVNPKELPDRAPAEYPAPWNINSRGNGHMDIFSANGKYVAHVYIWDDDDWNILQSKLDLVNEKIPCDIYGCKELKYKGEIFCSSCLSEYRSDPEAFK